jgi:hypothetical protein
LPARSLDLGFPRTVRDQVLVDAARHCCICHRYKGVKVEVHHITPEASGGEDSYENAIALCFDCHTDAGHYNPKHPRGTKFSPSELRKARNKWFKIVAENNIQEKSEPNNFYCRYYICKNYEQLREIAQGDLSRFPVENPLLIKNEIIEELNRVILNHPESYRYANAWGVSLPSKEKYIEAHPEALIPSESDGRYSYFEVIRTPTREELERYKDKDGLLKLMLSQNVPVKEISLVGGYDDGCGGSPLQEEYIFRKLWCSFLAITNLSKLPVTLESIRGKLVKSTGANLNKFKVAIEESESIPLPKAPVPPNSTVLIPLALILPPLYPINEQEWSQVLDDNRHLQITSERIERQELHELDLRNMYTIDRSWEVGSCPYLFLYGQKLSYYREVLSNCELIEGVDRFRVSENINIIIIAELEDEITELTSIKVGGDMVIENMTLAKYDSIEIPVYPGASVEIKGRYVPDYFAKVRRPCGLKRNELVSDYLYTYKMQPNKKIQPTADSVG